MQKSNDANNSDSESYSENITNKSVTQNSSKGLINWSELSEFPQDLRLIPVGENKNPLEKEWTNKGLSPTDFIEKFKDGPKVKAVGVVTGQGLIAVDIDGLNAVKLVKFICGSASLQDALPKTIKFTSGKEGRLQALYRVPEEYKDQLPNKKVFKVEGHALELRYNGHQSVIMGAHPETGSYKWVEGCSPSDTDIAQCPEWVLKLALGQPIDLFNLITSKWKEQVLTGFQDPEDFQDTTGSELAFYLTGLVNKCDEYGIKTTDPKIILQKYTDNCSDPFTEKHIDRWLGGANKKAPVSTPFKPVKEVQNKDSEPLDPEDKEDILKEISRFTQAKKFDISRLFPKPLADELNYQAGVFGQDGIILAAILLTIVSSLVGTKTKIVINHATQYIQSCIIWLALVGDSDAGKSPLMRLITKPLDKLQAESYETYLQEMERYKEESEAFEENKRKKVEDRQELEKPVKPNYRVYSFGDFTTEAIVKHIQPQPEKGSVIIADELAGFINSMDQYRGGKGGDRQKWLSLYNGDPINVLRVGKEPIYIPHTHVSIVGGIQPSTLKRTMGNNTEEVDGLWPRFIYFLLRDSIFPEPSKDHSSNNLLDLLYTLFKTLDNLTPKIYGLTEEAWELWLIWHNETEAIRIKAKHPAVKAIYRKGRDKAARIAEVIHLFNAAYDNLALNTTTTQACHWEKEPEILISKETLQVAIDFVKYSITDTLSIYGDFEIGVNQVTAKVKKFLERFKHDEDWITAKKINRAIFYGRCKVEHVRKFMCELVELKYCDSNGKSGSDFKIKINKLDVYDAPTAKNLTKQEIESGITPDDQVMSNDVQTEINGHKLDINGMTTDEQSENNGHTSYVSVISSIKSDITEASTLMPASNALTVTDSDQETSKTSLSNNGGKINHREYVKKNGDRLEVEIERLDLNYSPTVTPPKWEPSKKLDPYESKSKIYFDIETTGLDRETDRLIMVGMRNNKGDIIIFDDANEKVLLQNTINYLNNHKPDILIGHNLFKFDLDFLITRCHKYGVGHNFKYGKKERTITSSSFNGTPIKFTSIYLSNTQIIDTFHQICIWDKSASKLTSYNLKSSVLALELRHEKRLELSPKQIQECYKKGDLDTIKTYLTYDLEDTELLADFLIPIIYYQLKIVPNLSLQELAVVSPALKAQKIHQELIKGTEPTTDPTVQFEGGKVTLHIPGIHRNVAKIDATSLYPSIMLRYGICSKKDPKAKFLGVIEYMTEERLRLKKLAKEGSLEADHKQNALKILINGAYGFLGTGSYSYNDYEAAALVTAYGRKILNLMETVIKNNGGILIESDTDGVIFSHPDPETVLKGLSYELPEGIKVDLEYKDCVASVPKAKNYTIIKPDGKVIIKGVKRTDLPIVKEFKVGYLKAYVVSEDEAQSYYQNLITELQSGNYPLGKLTITRKIGKAEKTLVNLGIGQVGDIVSYYYGYGNKQNPVEVTSGDYNVSYYVEKIRLLMEEMTCNK